MKGKTLQEDIQEKNFLNETQKAQTRQGKNNQLDYT